MALVSPGISISVNDQSQYVGSNVGSVPLVLLATAQDKTYNGVAATGTSKANAGKLQSFTSQRDLITALGTPRFQVSTAGTPVNASEINEYGLLTAYSALGLGNQLYAIRADVDLNQLSGTSVRPTSGVSDGTYWLDLANTEFGIYALDAATSSFVHVSPLLITDATQVELDTDYIYEPPKPIASVGQQGSYALVFVNVDGTTADIVRLYHKTDATALGLSKGGPGAGAWVEVGSIAWQLSIPAVTGTESSGSVTIPTLSQFTINTENVIMPSSGPLYISNIATAINSAAIMGVKADVVNGSLVIYATKDAASDGTNPDGKLIVTDGTGVPLTIAGIPGVSGIGSSATFYSADLFYSSYTLVPSWFSTDSQPHPTGSIWWKTSSTGVGFSPVLKEYNASLGQWQPIRAPFGVFDDLLYSLDPAGGGINIQQGQIITLLDDIDTTANNLQFRKRLTAGIMTATGTTPSLGSSAGQQIQFATTVPGQNTEVITIITLSGTTAQSFVADLLGNNNNSAIPYVTAQVNPNGTISITHTAGGQITMKNVGVGTAVAASGFVAGVSPYIQILPNLSTPATVLSNFIPVTMDIIYSTTQPYSSPANGTLWYYSNAAEVDIMINNGGGWKGYRNVTSDIRGYNLSNTDSTGVIVSAARPTSQTSGASLVVGDLWLDSTDLINYPSLYRVSNVVGGTATWTKIDNTDRVSGNGIVFADARWDTDGTTDPISGDFPSIATLLTSNYIDQDAPDYRLYPRGTLLFNTRRSGYNVKKFVNNYFNNVSFPNPGTIPGTDNVLPTVKNAWVSDSGLKEDGSMYAGSAAQRAIVVAALKSAVDSNTDVLDANYRFNLLVAPGYPELIPNLVTLNDNRSNTGFIIGDTPMTLAPNATDITAWNSDIAGNGLSTSSAYLGVYYPAGLTNDLAGNNVAVPASHAVLRTFLYNDNVSYQWFAPAGINRGLVSNLSDIGYVNAKTGAFVHNGINQGLRDTLYQLSINPITQLPGTGIVVWGQETKSGGTTARNRVNVVRLENYLRTIFATIANAYLFEPNDTITRKSIASQIESSLHDLLSKRGLYDFLVICDTSNNTSSTIANNQLYVDVAVEPMRDVEFIYIPIALYNPGTVARLGAAST